MKALFQELRIPYFIQTQVFYPPSVPARQLHNLRLESLLCSITSYWLASCPHTWLIIRADPTGHTGIWNFPSSIRVYGRYKLVVTMLDLPTRGNKEKVDSPR